MPQGKHTTILAIGLSISLVAIVLFVGTYFLLFKGPKEIVVATKDGTIEVAEAGYDLLKEAGKDIRDALEVDPKITIGSKTVHGPSTKESKLVTATKTFQHTYAYEATWAGSTKRLELKGDFTANAGFTVDDTFSVIIAEDGQSLTLEHKDPEIISCELTKLQVIEDKNGLWNKVQSEERESATNELIRQARKAAKESDLLDAASQNLIDRFAPIEDKYSIDVKSHATP